MTPASNKKLFLLDAMALIYRAYFAFSKNPRYNSKGLNTSAVLGFTNTLIEVLNKEKPSHIAIAFDTSHPTTRHEEFAAYKAHREAMPEDLSKSIPYIMKLIEGFNIPMVIKPGYEADDIIGTLAKQAEKEGFLVYMMTPDKDYGQLVSENIFMYKPARMGNDVEIMGIPEVLKKFEITDVDQMRDLLGLWGDSADNIPGIPGVGEKTAKQIIAQFGSIENMIANREQLQGKLKEKVETFADQALLSKKLATIICDVPLDNTIEEFKLQNPNKEGLKELFGELEFRTLAKRIFGEDLGPATVEAPESQQQDLFGNAVKTKVAKSPTIAVYEEEEIPKELKTLKDIGHQYHLLDTADARAKLIAEIKQHKEFCFDTETTDIDANQAELVALTIAIKPHEAYLVHFPEDEQAAKAIITEFKALFEDESIVKIGQNIKYDAIVLRRYDIQVKGKLFDTMLAHYLLEPDMRHNMNIMAETYLNYSPIPIESLIGMKKSGQLSMRTVPVEQLIEYACEDADVTLQLKEILSPKLDESAVRKLFEEVELPLVPVLLGMETEGVKIDTAALKDISVDLQKDIAQLEEGIYESAGVKFNIASPKQLGDVLFDVLKIDAKAKLTKTKQYATGEEVLQRLIDKHPVVQQVLDYRELQKLKNTYVDTLPSMINSRTGRVHTSYNQAVAATGRLSSNNPNLQNIPIRTERGREVRKAFVSRGPEYTLLSADYSQIELRIMAEMSGDMAMQEAFINKKDIHTATASKVYGVELEDVTSEMRRNAKMVNFGIIYGISAFGLSQRLNIPRKEAAHIIEQYFAQYSRVKAYMDESINNAREVGYVETILGRKRYLRDINSANAVVRGYAERNAINAPIQGSAADLIKVAMINIHETFTEKGFRSKMILQVHDELVFDVYKEELELIRPIIIDKMTHAIPAMKVPMEVETGTGDNWLAAH